MKNTENRIIVDLAADAQALVDMETMADAPTQPGDVKNPSVMHACMKAAVEARVDYGLQARITARDHYKDAVYINPETAVEVVRIDDAGRGSRSDAGRNSMMDIQEILLSKMELLVVSSQDFRSEVQVR